MARNSKFIYVLLTLGALDLPVATSQLVLVQLVVWQSEVAAAEGAPFRPPGAAVGQVGLHLGVGYDLSAVVRALQLNIV